MADSDEDSFFILQAVTDSKPTVIEEPGSDTDWNVELLVNGSPVDFKIDTASVQPGRKSVQVNSSPTLYKGQRYRYWITAIKEQLTGQGRGNTYGNCRKSRWD